MVKIWFFAFLEEILKKKANIRCGRAQLCNWGLIPTNENTNTRQNTQTRQKSGVAGPNCAWDPVPRSNISRDSHKHKWDAVWISKNKNFWKKLRGENYERKACLISNKMKTNTNHKVCISNMMHDNFAISWVITWKDWLKCCMFWFMFCLILASCDSIFGLRSSDT